MGQNHRGLGTAVVTSKFDARLVVFHTFSPIYAYVFFRICRLIPLSLQNGAFDTFVLPLVFKWGQLPPLPPPGSAAYA